MENDIAKIVESHLCRYGWNFRSVAAGQWLTGWQGSERFFSLEITACSTWINLTVKPLVEMRDRWRRSRKLMAFLLRQNYLNPMIKLSYDEEGDLCLSMSLFSTNLSYEEFYNSVGILGHYSDHIYLMVLHKIIELESRIYPQSDMLT
jgi:hypothetical protein